MVRRRVLSGSAVVIAAGAAGGALSLGGAAVVGELGATTTVQQVQQVATPTAGQVALERGGRVGAMSIAQIYRHDAPGVVQVTATTLVRPPDRVDPATLAVLTDAVATPYHALAGIARVQPGETVVVVGIGGIGSNAVQVAKALGARVVAVSRSEEKRELARRLGADVAVALADAREAIGGHGADVVVQCAASPRMDEAAVELAGFAARVVFVATTPEPFSVHASALVWRELTLLGSRGFTIEDIEDVIRLHLAGTIATDHLTAHVRPLDEANEALDDLRSGRVLRSVLAP